MKKVIALALLIVILTSCISCSVFDNDETTSESSNQGYSASGYRATLVCPEDKSVDGKVIEVAWKRRYNFPIPKREFYSFEGWICGEDKLLSMDVWPYSHDAELVASWKPTTYTINYILSPYFTDAYSNYNTETDDFYLPSPMLVSGQMFVGWTGTDLDVANRVVLIPTGSHGNRKYTANWISAEDIENKTEDGFAIEIVENYAVIVGYFGEAKDILYIPSEYNGYPIKVIGEGALFGLNRHFKELHIPYTINRFDDYALGSGWAIYIDDGDPDEWLTNTTFGIGNGTFSE